MSEVWNLRRVRERKSPCACCPPQVRTRVREVYYDESGTPWTYSDAGLLDKIRLVRDWITTPVLTFPDDFTGEPAWLKDLQDMVKNDADSHRL